MPTATELLAAILDELDGLAPGERVGDVRDRIETIGLRHGLLPHWWTEDVVDVLEDVA